MSRAGAASRFDQLIERAAACLRCPTMDGRRRILSAANGSASARIVLVGEAPGRLGAERTGIPFSGDRSGDRFGLLLAEAGWSRADVFVTNAVLCSPLDAEGRNRAPSRLELTACHEHLAATLDVIRPALIVALGRRAQTALGLNELLVGAVPGELRRDDGRWAAWMWHPSVMTQTQRRWPDQLADWRALGDAYRALPPEWTHTCSGEAHGS